MVVGGECIAITLSPKNKKIYRNKNKKEKKEKD